ncbi:ABC transporter permease [Methylococcus capsulatus]|uniref:Efflux ABC-transporter, permease protein n=2 Tax=Methylococcus capsulatus TaxID=414 RepID=Q604I9_METCA|nr:ABC transporter permease [Methylococcus capsulatus]AAU91381.1 efflux ABC-transporter, permease protein [Methylococcus capsulatus str. Bath]QXP86883.1 ABC transporter permease [Methylococcus capsulatus]QXP92140.1 ABC transporter permease [Methylococcus capsulatus]QXP95218.1 ABC transporter permease [Methylococcus capsulatus]UQN11865.1 ABC transporter permease [Methylococcus capsulatus]
MTWAGLLGPFRVLARERQLLGLLVRRDIIGRTRGTVLGWVWMLAQPALQVVAFWFLLDFVLRLRVPGKVAFIDYFLTAMLPWLFISDTLNRCLSVLTEFSSLYKRTVFPLKVLPLLPGLSGCLVYTPIYAATMGLLAGPGAAVQAVLLMTGLLVLLMPACYLLAVLGCFVKDLRQAFPFTLNMLLYLTPILYLPEMLPQEFRELLVVNPLADVMAVFESWIHGLPVTAGNFIRPLLLWLLSLGPAWVLFHRGEPHIREAV